ncbi:hypothetical protein DBR47_15440 [Paucibacter sp. KBW04]|uniref:DUF5713 family protein n=1 Tax=Paucibacter sp. KBW04 TaxID=2153361 RepID=UPI000F5639E4|nr:DUF5713 family protein [Paucibacter sp. KBW04]RQO57224.1 hypothetical protein DBR47_15440 [Paucibacter sp. KBW04]
MAIANKAFKDYVFLADMLSDKYFPSDLVRKGQQVLIRLCETMEAERPVDLESLYKITQSATEEFNVLAEEFEANGSEIETAARESIGADFEFIAKAYGFDADLEELISNREW